MIQGILIISLLILTNTNTYLLVSAKTADDQISAKVKKVKFQKQWANSVDPDEAAHYELHHQGLCCLQIQLFTHLALEAVRHILWSLTDVIMRGHIIIRNGISRIFISWHCSSGFVVPLCK